MYLVYDIITKDDKNLEVVVNFPSERYDGENAIDYKFNLQKKSFSKKTYRCACMWGAFDDCRNDSGKYFHNALIYGSKQERRYKYAIAGFPAV